MTLILVVAFLATSISFFCSLLEAVFLSITPTYVALALKENKRSGKLLEHLKENLDRPISAILTLNTVSHTVGASVVGALVQKTYGDEFVTISSIILTIAILLFSEIIPKIIGATYWKQLAPFAAYSIQLMIFSLYPFVRLSELTGKLFVRPDQAVVTREELIASAEIGADEGSIREKESTIIKNLLMLNNMYVSDIMTPRSVMYALEVDELVDNLGGKNKQVKFSRIPVFQGNLDNIVGMTYRFKILEALGKDDSSAIKVRDLMSPINSVSERMTVSGVIDLFIKKKEHMALAVDEYGIITGLVTLEDAIETLLGVEIVDESDTIPDMRQYALDQWQMRKNQLRRS